jgi:predicted GIY-YIG superfamily endonuclease
MTTIVEPTALYRVWGKADLLLYIGISKDFGARWKQHAKQQPWWDEMKRLTADEWFDSRDKAETAETAAIRAENPKYNIAKTQQPTQPTWDSLSLWVGDGDLADQIRRIATGPCQNSALVRLMVVALFKGYRQLPVGHELEELGAVASISKSSVYRLVRRARMESQMETETKPAA